MILRATVVLAVLAASQGCRTRETHPPERAATDAGTTTVPPSRPSTPPPPPIAVQGPWQTTEARGAAVTPALWLEGAVRSAMAMPAEDATGAEMRWLRWADGAATVVGRHTVRWIPPGSAMSLVPRTGGATVVWPTAPGGDAGAGWRAIDVSATGFEGNEREATALEVAASEWALTAMGRRSREGVDEPAPTVTRASVALRVEPRRAVPVALLGDVELTRGDDLMGFERALGLDPDDTAGRWAALSRGRCQDARLELYRVQRDQSEWKGAVAIGREVGVRWLSVDAGPTSVVVSWYQDLIPMRLQCTRGSNAPTVADQGLRVALFPR